MKALSVLFFAAFIIFSSCSKDRLPVSGSSNISSAKGSSTAGDNPNGGGGDNIAATTVPVELRILLQSFILMLPVSSGS